MTSGDTSSLRGPEPGPTVWVLSGGDSSEREVSLRSGAAVFDALQSAAASGKWSGTAVSVVLDADGAWETPMGSLGEVDALKLMGPDHVAFLALHGGRGEDGRIQAALESAGVAYTGSGPAASSLCMDKRATRGVLMDEGVRVPPGMLVSSFSRAEAGELPLRQEIELLSPDGEGWFIKPNRGGSSSGVSLVSDSAELLPKISQILDSGDRALVEARIPGTEISVGVIGVTERDLRPLPVVEIRPRGSTWFDPEEKYAEDGAEEVCPAESISEALAEEAQMAAIRAHIATGCSGYSRTDFIVSDGGDIYALEINTLPGLTERSLLPLEAKAAGMPFEALCLEILSLADTHD